GSNRRAGHGRHWAAGAGCARPEPAGHLLDPTDGSTAENAALAQGFRFGTHPEQRTCPFRTAAAGNAAEELSIRSMDCARRQRGRTALRGLFSRRKRKRVETAEGKS